MEIYKITNKLNGKVYIGKTVHKAKYRWKRHLTGSKSSAISGALAKYGKENFTFEVIDTATSEIELNTKEIDYIAACTSVVPHGYNLTYGGEGSAMQYTETARANMRASHKHTKTFLGKTHTEETRKLLSDLARGKIAWNRNVPTSEVTRVRISAALKGRKVHNKGKCLYRVIGPGCIFESIQEAASHFNITTTAIRLRCKRTKEWKLVPRESL